MTKRKEDRRPKKKKEPEKGAAEKTGIATGALKGLGGVIPGFKHVVEALEKSEPFRDRLKEIDAEAARRLREGWSPSAGPGPRLRSIPPRTRSIGGTARSRARPKAARPPHRPIRVDLLEEGKNVRAIAEMPGVAEKDIRIELEGNRLVLAADSPRGLQFGEFILPRPCASVLERHYRNGVLDLLLGGEDQE